MKAELENAELDELWAQYASIRAKLTARLEAEIGAIERHLFVLREERRAAALQSRNQDR